MVTFHRLRRMGVGVGRRVSYPTLGTCQGYAQDSSSVPVGSGALTGVMSLARVMS